MNPLTHHEIISLAAPFARSGRHVDLGTSDRLQRRLAFKPVALRPEAADAGTRGGGIPSVAGRVAPLPPLREQLLLENTSPGWFRLTRSLALPDGSAAALVCEGADAAALWAAVDAVPAQRQVQALDGGVLVFSHRLWPESGRLILTAATTWVAGLRLSMAVSRVKGISAEVDLGEGSADAFDLPEDLLAVLGLPWSRLSRAAGAWRASIVLRGEDVERTRDAETKFARSAAHLAAVLGDAPALFHPRFRRARWGVALRRLTPLLVAAGLIGAALLVPRLDLGHDSVVRMLIFNSPPLLLVWLFTLREMPRLEIPPLPRPLAASGWRSANASATAPLPVTDSAR